MASNIDPTQPATGNASTAAVRGNFAAAKAEIEALQSKAPQILTQTDGDLHVFAVPIPGDDSIPQSNEGTELFSQAITPRAAENRITVTATVYLSPSVTSACILALFKGNAANAVAAMGASVAADNNASITITYSELAGSLDARTYRLRVGQSAGGNLTVNGWGGARRLGGVAATCITVREDGAE